MNKIKHAFIALLAVSAFLLPGAVSTPRADVSIPNHHPLCVSGAFRLKHS